MRDDALLRSPATQNGEWRFYVSFVYYIYMVCKSSVGADHLMTFKNAAFGEMKRDLLVGRFVLAGFRLFTEVWNFVPLDLKNTV